MSSRRGGAISDAGRQIAGGRLAEDEEGALRVQRMFDRIATSYELLNTLMTAGLHRAWNKKAAEAAELHYGKRALDLACGTGSLTRNLAKRIGPDGYVLGVDFSKEMLEVAKRRPAPNIEYQFGDATELEGIEDNSFDVTTIAYGARNIPDLNALFSEMIRVVKPGGKAVCLEIAQPKGYLSATFYRLWFDKVVPRLGAIVSGDDWAYSYLPRSVKEFVAPDELSDIMRRNGLQEVTWRGFSGGIITLHTGTKPG
jgi:demethylmenaquinone methyltransferase/2-methoxy-6-polyprenyl-1,4-benzoquinol methylase